jgi:hypothetical protein
MAEIGGRLAEPTVRKSRSRREIDVMSLELCRRTPNSKGLFRAGLVRHVGCSAGSLGGSSGAGGDGCSEWGGCEGGGSDGELLGGGDDGGLLGGGSDGG